ncbi:hypothetical protein [Porphyromonas levii]|uniref:hypothetical protein n=1 Tax=Porphyromonas levii TaxID=28114 RepID=UPI001B8BB9EB|nr:hypothetical protein [Porphyromonas levii]MBR8759279.1 hypothetical protein [Porphyromonas levii]
MRGILLDKENDLMVQVTRDAEGKISSGLQIGNTNLQNAYMVLSLNQGELKEDPIAGVNLIAMIRGNKSSDQIKTTIKIGLRRCGIDYDEVKNLLRVNGQEMQ